MWKSPNAGNLSPSPVAVNWTPLTDNQATLAIGAVAVQKHLANPNPANSVILAGTGETDSSGDSYYGLGILRSADGGQSWVLIPQDSTGKINLKASLHYRKFAWWNTQFAFAGERAPGAPAPTRHYDDL